jgi:ABC-2 type transport system permease protein
MRSWNWRGMRAVIGKDLGQVRQNTMVWLPMVILPVILQVIMPLFMILLPQLGGQESMNMEDIEPLIRLMPASLNPAGATTTPEALWVIMSSCYMFAPFFLIVPLMVSSILAADSIVGEKERKTLESLLYTPLSDAELYIAKALVSILPALSLTVVSFVVYTIVVNAAGYATVGRLFFPTLIWWPLVFWVAPAVSVAGLGVTVLISSKAKSFMQAQQSSGILVLPIVAWMAAQAAGVFFMGPGLLTLIGLIVWAIGLWLIWIGSRTLSRSNLISRV